MPYVSYCHPLAVSKNENIRLKIMKRLLYILFFLIIFSSCSTFRNFQVRKEKQNLKESFHIYLLLGQSNMAGRGDIEEIDTIIHPRVYMLNKDTSWVIAKNPLHFDSPKAVGTGLGLSFAKKMAEHDTLVTIGLIPCAKGGTSIKHWFVDTYHKKTNSYPYNETISRIEKGKNRGVIKGVLWHQGESDCKAENDVKVYKEKFLAFKDSLEKDLDLKSTPFIIGELGYFLYDKRPLAEDLNELFKEISFEDNCIGFVKSDSLNHKGDKVHFNSTSYRKLGLRYADEMIKIQEQCLPPTRNKKHRAKRGIFRRNNF